MTSPQVSADAPPVAGVDAPAQGASAHYGHGVRIDAMEGGPSVIGHGGAGDVDELATAEEEVAEAEETRARL